MKEGQVASECRSRSRSGSRSSSQARRKRSSSAGKTSDGVTKSVRQSDRKRQKRRSSSSASPKRVATKRNSDAAKTKSTSPKGKVSDSCNQDIDHCQPVNTHVILSTQMLLSTYLSIRCSSCDGVSAHAGKEKWYQRYSASA